MAFDTAPTAHGLTRTTAHEVRQRLEHERNARLTQLNALDEAGHTAADDLVAAQRASVERVLKEIEAAFDRLENGTYGACQECAKPVPDERLEIVPYTPHCVGCSRRPV